jgi:Na+/proline symporter
VRVSKEQRITSVSDFISSRYGKSAPYAGISGGFFVWFYTLIIPALGKESSGPAFLSDGPSASLLRPTAFLGLSGLDTATGSSGPFSSTWGSS